MAREVTHCYEDPLDTIWRRAATRVGLRIDRSSEVYAATDGQGSLILGTPETLDPDDCLSQMVFHEICHGIVQGPQNIDQPDWGLDNVTDRDVYREHACLRLQAALAQRHGLRRFFAPTTDFRMFYDALGDDPMRGDRQSVELAREALSRSSQAPWQPALDRALRATEVIARAIWKHGSAQSEGELPGMWTLISYDEPERS